MAKTENNESNYSVTIAECSKDLSAKERVQLKDTTDTIKIESEIKTEPLIINVAWYAVLEIHNEKAENADYTNFIIVDDEGKRYRTGSHTFFNQFKLIADEMIGTGEDWQLKIYAVPSKNREGKSFITCSIV